MSLACPKCGRNVPDDAVYCPYCAYGLKPSALTGRVSAAGVLMLVAGSAFFVIFVLSVSALLQIYSWYPPLTAQMWFLYDAVFTGFCLFGFLLAMLSSALIFARRFFRPTITLAVVSTLLGASVFVTSMIIPEFNLTYSFLTYFLPMLLSPLIGVFLIFPRKQEFRQSTRQKN
jgi:zinc-ribbon domain